jgi:hypothetical protein
MAVSTSATVERLPFGPPIHKLISAVIIMRLVEQGYLKLSDRPQDVIATWPIVSGDPLFHMTLT